MDDFTAIPWGGVGGWQEEAGCHPEGKHLVKYSSVKWEPHIANQTVLNLGIPCLLSSESLEIIFENMRGSLLKYLKIRQKTLGSIVWNINWIFPDTYRHSSVVAWRIPGTEEPGGLPSVGSHRVGHDWSDLAVAHTSKVMFKILQARLQQYVNRELQMFKLVLEKAEEPEIKLQTSAGSSKKQESSRKTSVSVLLTMPSLWLCASQ